MSRQIIEFKTNAPIEPAFGAKEIPAGDFEIRDDGNSSLLSLHHKGQNEVVAQLDVVRGDAQPDDKPLLLGHDGKTGRSFLHKITANGISYEVVGAVE